MSVARLPADWPAPGNIVAGTTLRQRDIDASTDPGLRGEPCWLNQVHGNKVVDVACFESPPDADAAIGRKRGDVCVVRSADCLPVLLCSSDGGVFAAAHAGWRGLAAGVLENTVVAMGVEVSDLMAWFGPAISQSRFEVGDEVRDVFVQHDAAATACFVANQEGRWQADLYSLARQRLNAAGVIDLHGGGLCTYTDNARFWSYRRDPSCGRMVSFITSTSERV